MDNTKIETFKQTIESFTDEEHLTWTDNGFDIVESVNWKSFGFTPEEALEWREYFDSPVEAISWAMEDIDAETANHRKEMVDGVIFGQWTENTLLS